MRSFSCIESPHVLIRVHPSSRSASPLVYLKAPRHRAPSLDFLQERGRPGCGPGALAPSPHTISTAALHRLASNICVVWPFRHQFVGIGAVHRVWFGKRPYLLTRYLCCSWRLSHPQGGIQPVRSCGGRRWVQRKKGR